MKSGNSSGRLIRIGLFAILLGLLPTRSDAQYRQVPLPNPSHLIVTGDTLRHAFDYINMSSAASYGDTISRCPALHDALLLLRAHRILGEWFQSTEAPFLEVGAQLAQMESSVLQRCMGRKSMGARSYVLGGVDSTGEPGVHMPAPVLSYLMMTDIQRQLFESNLSFMDQLALYSWITDNYETATSIAQSFGQDLNLDLELSPELEFPGTLIAPEEVPALPEIPYMDSDDPEAHGIQIFAFPSPLDPGTNLLIGTIDVSELYEGLVP